MGEAGSPPRETARAVGSAPRETASEPEALHVVATAGHVDHGKSALILRLTGIDPDRLAEEKRRGLTIDLGFAWTRLPSGREVGFVDVPGHERFIRNMLAGVGPVRTVLFVVAADEGWKPQSEEHLQIVDVLGVDGAVVALTKRDLVDAETLAARMDDVRRRLRGTRLEEALVVACSATTGQGLEDLTGALDDMLAGAPAPEIHGRPRQFLDRIFTIKGAGTVVTGTLIGGPLAVGQEVEILPSGHRARIRGLQTHKRSLGVASPVSRVAVNLAGTPKAELERGDVLALPGQWRATSVFEGGLRPVRALDHALTARGAYKLYAGSAERDARIRLYDVAELRAGQRAFVRVTLSRPVVLDVHDSFVLREAGRQETVAGGEVLDVDPPSRPGPGAAARLTARSEADRETLAWLLVVDRGTVRVADVMVLTGSPAAQAIARGAVALDGWLAAPELVQELGTQLSASLADHHAKHPLRPGLEIAEARSLLADLRPAFSDPDLADALLGHLAAAKVIARDATVIRLPSHSLSTAGRDDADGLVETVRKGEPSPPSVKELAQSGFDLELIRAVCAEGRLVRVSPDIVVTPDFIARAEAVVRSNARLPGLTVSEFKEALGTSRKYALPILEYFDTKGVTRRQGDFRVPRG
jgi:selenocysteine-specific elongation factor